MEYNVGDTVVLNSGGPVLTIRTVKQNDKVSYTLGVCWYNSELEKRETELDSRMIKTYKGK